MKTKSATLLALVLMFFAHDHALAQVRFLGVQVMAVEKFVAVENKLTLQTLETVIRPVTEQRTTPDGKVQDVVRYVSEERVRQHEFQLTEISMSTAAGKQLVATDAVKQLKEGQAVIVHFEGTSISKLQRSLYRDDAIIIEIRQPAPVNPKPSAPMPGHF